jgi:hypothetical protein
MFRERLIETSVSRNRAQKRSGMFLAAIPWGWLVRAGNCPGKALQVAVAVRHQAKLEKSKRISLGNRFLGEMGVSKDAKKRALDALEQEGLIQVERKPGNNPRVTIVESGSE